MLASTKACLCRFVLGNTDISQTQSFMLCIKCKMVNYDADDNHDGDDDNGGDDDDEENVYRVTFS